MSVPDPPAAPSAADHFPYVCAPEAGVPPYLRLRAETQPGRDRFWRGLAYLRKYRRSKRSAPAEEVRYFDGQRHLVRWLAAQPLHLTAVAGTMP